VGVTMADVETCKKQVNAGIVSYLVSAPLHGRGLAAFWQPGKDSYHDKDYCMVLLTRLIAVVDLVYHVALWIALAVFEGRAYDLFQNQKLTDYSNGDQQYFFAEEGTYVAEVAADPTATPPVEKVPAHYTKIAASESARILIDELVIGQFTLFMLSIVLGLAATIIFGLMGQPAGKAWPATLSFLIGGLKGSLIFSTLVVVVSAMKWNGFMNAQHPHEEVVTFRQLLLWGIAFKSLLLMQLDANRNFWGNASSNDLYANMCWLLGSKNAHGHTYTYNKDTPNGSGSYGRFSKNAAVQPSSKEPLFGDEH
jgi:hypothetical protein